MRARRSGGIGALALGCLVACRGWGGGGQSGNTPVTPAIAWAAPAAIAYGTALSAAQLNATASVAGTFAYSPPADTVLPAGEQTLTAAFTPADPNSAGPGPAADGYVARAADGATFIWASGDTVPAWSRVNGNRFFSSTGAPAGLMVISDRVNPNKFYGYDPSTGTLFVSTDGGASFAAGATGLPRDVGNPGWTAEAQPKAVFGQEGDLWLPTAGGLYHSTDSGASFTRIGSIDSAPLVGFGMAAPGASYPAVYAVGTIGGVYGIFRSDDAGNSWTRVNDDAHQYGALGTITGDPQIYGRVYAGTQGRGIVYGDIAPAGPGMSIAGRKESRR